MTTENIANYLTSEIKTVQEFMDANITVGVPMTAATIYEKIKGSLSKDINENVFKTSLSASISLGRITGFKGRKRVGYCKIDENEIVTNDLDTQSDSDPESAPTDDGETVSEDKKFTVNISNSLRIIYADRHNFTVQKLGGNIWHNESYNTSLGESMRSAARMLIKNGMKGHPVVINLKDAVKAFEKMEAVILGEILNLPKQTDAVSPPDDEVASVEENSEEVAV